MDIVEIPEDARDWMARWLTDRAATLLVRSAEDRESGLQAQAVGGEIAASELRAFAVALGPKHVTDLERPEAQSPALGLESGPEYLGRLRTLMDRRDIRNVDLAREMGKAESQVSRMFSKGTEPRYETKQDIEKALREIRRRRDREAQNVRGGGGQGVQKVGSDMADVQIQEHQ